MKRWPSAVAMVLTTCGCVPSLAALPAPPPSSPSPPAATESGRALVDQAATILARLSADGSDTSALLGVLSADQRDMVENASRDAVSLLVRAEARIADEIAGLETGIMGGDADPAAAARRAAEVEAELARLIDIEQSQRLPFYRGMALALVAGAADGPARTSAARQAVSLLTPLAPGSPAADAQRRIHLAAALLMSGPMTESLAADVTQQLAPIAGDDPAAGSAGLARRIVSVTLAEEWATFARQPGMSAAVAEATARALVMRSRSDSVRRSQLIGAACRVLLDAAATTHNTAARLRTYAKIAHIIEPGIDTAALPAEAALARAITLLRTSPESAEARALLAIARERADSSVAVRAAALWELAAIALRDDSDAGRREAFAALEALLELRAGPPRHAQAAELLDRLGEALAAEADVSPSERDRLERTRIAALTELTSADRSRADAARLTVWDARLTALRARRADPARVRPDEIEQFVRALQSASGDAPHIAELRRAVDQLLTAMRRPSVWQLRPAAERMRIIPILLGSSSTPDAELELLAGRTLIELAQPAEAVARLRPLLGTPLDRPDQATHADLRLALAGGLAAVGDAAARAEALSVLRELTAPFDDLPPASSRPGFYWPAWAAALELLLRDANSNEQADAIRAQLTRLELIDKTLGGSAHAEAFARIRAAVSRP